MRKRFTTLLATVAIAAFGFAGTAVGHAPADRGDQGATVSKTCGHGTPAQTPGGVKCLAPGEYCSHKRGYAAAYSRAGFRCNANGRLEYD